ncbi:MAG TPA: TonB-dependent receptor, partial [Vicinamibacteria bacterium]|nr:TonB-dependent receptor [Vicinamibacteria bacterium]
MKRIALSLAMLLAMALPIHAQLATGNIYGTVTDESGAALPGASVTVKGPGGSFSTVCGADGRFRVLNLDPGAYHVTTALAGFATITREHVVVATGTNVDITIGMKVASVAETLTVTAETPVLDPKRTGTATVFTQDELAKIPNSRDPWALLRTVPGVVMDRVNIAGNESGQQSAYRAKGASGADGVWSMDGVNVTDMAAIGASPTYFDYDAFQEIQISTSGNDIRQPTGGVGINFVTKRGTNDFHASAHGYFTNHSLSSSNVPAELTQVGLHGLATAVTPDTANHDDQIADYGFDVGGPIIKNKLWFWASWGKQDIRLVRSAGALIDKTILKDQTVKVNWQAGGSDMISGFWFVGDKQKFGRATGACAGCVEAATAVWNQSDAFPDSRPHGLWKLEDNHTFNPSFFLSTRVAYYGTGFQLAPSGGLANEAGLAPRLGQTFGTTRLSLNVRPQYIANTDGNYFLGRHEIKFGVGYRWTEALTETLWPGDEMVAEDFTPANQRVRLYREGLGKNRTFYTNAYVGDTLTKDRLTLNLGLRFDHQTGRAAPTVIGGNGAFSNLVPGISFPGYDAPFAWNDFSPRVGATYALDKDRRTLVRASYARYVTQLDTGTVGWANPSANAGWAEYPWKDANGDHFAQVNEVTITPNPLATGGGFNVANPTGVGSANIFDPNLKAPLTNEGVVGIDRELMPNLAVSLTYTYRRLTRFLTYPRINMTTADYAAGTPITGLLPDGTSYNVPIFIPNAAKSLASGNGRIQTNDSNYYQTFNGIEFSATKRLANKWMARIAAAWNNHQEFFDGVPVDTNFQQVSDTQYAPGNPTPLDTDALINGGQVAPRSAGSGFGDVFINAKWAVNANVLYQLPWNLDVAANLFGKQGTPFPLFANVALGQDGTQRVLVTPAVDYL